MLLNYESLGSLKWVLWAITLAICVFLLVPIIFIVLLSFGSSQWLLLPPPAWDFRWYEEFFDDPRWLESMWVSFKIAVMVTILSVIIGFLTSYGLVRKHFKGREFLRAFFLTPMIFPVIVLAIALYGFFLYLGLNGTLVGFVIAHLIIALPFSITVISTALESFDESLENAAILCGASPWMARLKITIPCIKNGIFSAGIFSFLISWDEVILAIFMASPTIQTFPVRIWGMLRQDLTPVIAAASTILIALTIILMILIAFLKKERKE